MRPQGLNGRSRGGHSARKASFRTIEAGLRPTASDGLARKAAQANRLAHSFKGRARKQAFLVKKNCLLHLLRKFSDDCELHVEHGRQLLLSIKHRSGIRLHLPLAGLPFAADTATAPSPNSGTPPPAVFSSYDYVAAALQP